MSWRLQSDENSLVRICTQWEGEGRNGDIPSKCEALLLRQKPDVIPPLAAHNTQRGGSAIKVPHRRIPTPPNVSSALLGDITPRQTGGSGATIKTTIEQLILLVQKKCQITDGNDTETGNMRRGKRICEEVCKPVLLERRCYCLCSCGWHREECPVHRVA